MMNKTLAGIELLYKKGEFSQEEYESTARKYKAFKYAVNEIEESIQIRIEALMYEEIQETKESIHKTMAILDAARIKEYQAEQDRKSKIFDLYAKGMIDEDTVRQMLKAKRK